jgi:hypothetical protein
MIHNPMGGDTKSLLAIKESLMSVYKSFFPNEDELNQMMNDETWLMPDDLLKRGIVNTIIYTDSNVQLEISESTNLLELHALCNSVNKKTKIPMAETPKKSIIEKFKDELDKLKNKITLTNADEDPKEEEKVEDPKADAEEESGEDDVYQQMIDIVKALTEKIESLMKANEEKEAENKALKNKSADEDKIKVLTESGISNKEFDKWLKLDLETIKNLTKSVKVSVKSPELKIDTSMEKKFSDMTKEEKLAWADKDPKAYYEEFKKSGKQKR